MRRRSRHGRAVVIPAYVNNFNLLTSTRALCERLSRLDDVHVVIVDNASTYEPLHGWYDSCGFEVVRLPSNLGKHAPWLSGAVLDPAAHQRTYGSEFYVVTDPDLCLEGVPDDVIAVLVEALARHKDATKVGLSLGIDDLPVGSRVAYDAQAWEEQFWKRPVDDGFFQADVDTTFAAYRTTTRRELAMSPSAPALRAAAPYTARHRPWYWAPESLGGDELEYVRASKNGFWNAAIRRQRDDPSGSRAPGAGSPAPYYSTRVRPLGGLPGFVPPSLRARHDRRWRMSDSGLDALALLLDSAAPRSAVEFGSGASTLAVAQHFAGASGGSFASFEADPSVADRVREQLAGLGLDAACVRTCAGADGGFDRETVEDLSRSGRADLVSAAA